MVTYGLTFNRNCSIDSEQQPACLNGFSTTNVIICDSTNDPIGLLFRNINGLSQSITNLASITNLTIINSFLSSTDLNTILSSLNLKYVALVDCLLQGALPVEFSKYTYLNLANNPNLLGFDTGSGVSLSESFCTGNLSYLNIKNNKGLGCYPVCLLQSITDVDVSGLSMCSTDDNSICLGYVFLLYLIYSNLIPCFCQLLSALLRMICLETDGEMLIFLGFLISEMHHFLFLCPVVSLQFIPSTVSSQMIAHLVIK
jgi:hypothetical protein